MHANLFSSDLSHIGCHSPAIELIPSASSTSTPLRFRQNQNIHLSSDITINCSQSSLITTQWTIITCFSTCSNTIQPNQSLDTSQGNLFITARILSYGIYKVQLTVTMTDYPLSSSSSFIYIEITRPVVIINLISFPTSMITQDDGEDLTLNPGEYSINLNRVTFNKVDWIYLYYCRMGLTSVQSWKSFEHPHQPCLENQFPVSWKYDDPLHSSMTIFAHSLRINETYQFMVQMINRHNSTVQSIEYLTVDVKDIQSPIILISCTIFTMCSFNGKFHYVNPSSQLSLFSMCVGDCQSIDSIQWNVYQGSINSTFNQSIQWLPSPSISSSLFYGLRTKNLTIVKEFFIENQPIIYWRLEVIYSFGLTTSNQTFDIEVNEVPKNGICFINPPDGTIITLFTINCSNWFDKDEIKDYTIYGWTNDSSPQMMLVQSTESIIQLRLPARIDPQSTVDLIVHIRDSLGAISEFHPPPVTVLPDYSAISSFIRALQKTNNNLLTDPIFQLLTNSDQNTVGQIVTSISQVLNEMHDQSIEWAAQNGLSPTSISVTSLNNEIFYHEMNGSNDWVLIKLKKQLNDHALLRESLLMFITNLSINTPIDVTLQSSILSKLTERTNQLTRQTSSVASTKCEQLAHALKSIASRISAEDVNLTVNYLLQCAVNVFNGVNGALQGRVDTLDLDLIRTQTSLDNDEQNDWDDPNLYYQKESVNHIGQQMDEIISSITSSLNLHLNLEQTIEIKTNSIEFSLEKLPKEYLTNSSNIRFPSTIAENDNETILLRKILQPLALGDQNDAYTNFSRSFSLSILDQNQTETKIQTNFTDSMEFFIPRDGNVIIPAMYLHNVTALNNEEKELFYYHHINLTQNNPNLTFSIHLEIQPLNLNLSYLLIYQFDQKSHLYSMENWKYLCLPDLNEDQIYVHFLDNHQTLHHHFIIYGIRQLNITEMNQFCANQTLHPNTTISNQPFHFTSNYRIRVYQSGCFYLDSNNQWQSDGLLVGPMTNHKETQCFSTHLTSFSSALRFLHASNHLGMSSTIVSRQMKNRSNRREECEMIDLDMNRSIALISTMTNLERIAF